MSSHMASFVAAVLRDQALAEVVEENEQMKEQTARAALIEVTGAGGSPVYATGNITEGSAAGSGERWLVKVQQQNNCPLNLVSSVEIYLGGVPLLLNLAVERAPCSVLDFVEGCYDDDGYGLFDFNRLASPSVGYIEVRCGPFESIEDYEFVDDGFYLQDNPFQGYHMAQLGEEYPTMTVRFGNVQFCLPQMLPSLERFGISKEEATRLPDDALQDTEESEES